MRNRSYALLENLTEIVDSLSDLRRPVDPGEQATDRLIRIDCLLMRSRLIACDFADRCRLTLRFGWPG